MISVNWRLFAATVGGAVLVVSAAVALDLVGRGALIGSSRRPSVSAGVRNPSAIQRWHLIDTTGSRPLRSLTQPITRGAISCTAVSQTSEQLRKQTPAGDSPKLRLE